MFALPFMRRRGGGGGAASIPPGTYATPQDVAAAISQLIGGAPDVTLDTIAEIAARIIQDESSLAAVSAAIANKQDKNAKLTALSSLALAADKLIYATGVSTLATTDLTAFMRSVLAAQDAAGARAAIGAIGNAEAGTFGKAMLALEKPADGSVPLTSNANGGATTTPTSAIGRAFMNLAATVNAIPWMNGAGSLVTTAIGNFGRFLLAQHQPAIGSMPSVADANGNVLMNPSAAFGRSLLNATDKATLRHFIGHRLALFSSAASKALAPGVEVELNFSAIDPGPGFYVGDLNLVGGRIANTTSGFPPASHVDISGSLFVDAACDLVLRFELLSYQGVLYTTGQFAPVNVPLKCSSAGQWNFEGPKGWPTSAGSPYQSVRIWAYTPSSATGTVNVTKFYARVEQWTAS